MREHGKKTDMTETSVRNETGRKGVFLAWRRYKADRRGVAAVEFALIVPLLLAMYLGTMEISNGIALNKRVARMASAVADLVAQQDEVSKTDLEEIMKIGEAILYPYTGDKPKITITAVDVKSTHPKWGKVLWSRQQNKDGTYATGAVTGSDVNVPNRLRIDNSFVLLVRGEVKYLPVVTWVTGKDGGGNPLGIDFSEQYWLHPRLSDSITCTNC